MARIPAPGQPAQPDPLPTLDAQIPEEVPPVPTEFGGQAWGGAADVVVPLTEEQLRTAAGNLGLEFDAMNAEEHEFVAMFARGALDSLPPGGDPENPLIPPPVDTAEPAAPPADPDALATPETGAEGAGVGSASDAMGSGGESVPPVPTPTATSPEQQQSTPPAAPLGYEIPSPLPPAPPQVDPDPAPPGAEPLVMLPNGVMVPYSVAVQMSQQAVQQPVPQQIPQPPANPWEGSPTIPGQTPPPFGQEWVDERAGAEITALNQRIAQFEQQQAASQRIAQQQHEAAINQAISEARQQYAVARGLTEEQALGLQETATRLGAIGMYAQMYPGDPRRAVGAALENAFWITPEYRDAYINAQVQAIADQNAAVDERKANAGSLASSPGSVPRTPAPARNRAEADAGIVAMIESDLAAQNGAPTRRR